MRTGVLLLVLSACGPTLPTSGPAGEYFASERREPESEKARACNAGSADACTKLAFTFHDPGKEGGNPREAVAFHTRGCNLGSPVSCYNLGFQYWRGKGVKADAAHAATLYRRACLLGLHDGCNAAPRAEADARAVPSEPTPPTPPMEQAAEAKTQLRVVASVPAEVFVDGLHRGSAPAEVDVDPGEHPVVIIAPGDYVRWQETVQVPFGKTTTLTADILPVQWLRVQSSPAGARVFLNGQEVGVTPYRASITRRTNVVRIEHESYLPFQQTVEYQPGVSEVLVAPELITAP